MLRRISRNASLLSAGILFAILIPLLAHAGEPLPFRQLKPDIQFGPPDLQFSDLEVRKLDGGVSVISIPWIGEYLVAAFRFALPVGAIIAVVIIMIAGIRWMVSGGGGGKQEAMTWMTNAVIGLVVLVSAYVILRTINPDLVNLDQLQVRIVAREEFAPETEPEVVTGIESSELTRPTGIGLAGTALFERALLPDLEVVGRSVDVAGYGVFVASGFRSVAQQIALIRENCQNPPQSSTCNPKSGRPTTCILRAGPASCPHTTGRAVDAWGTRNGAQCIRQAECLKDRAACRANPCQAAIIAAMRRQGFCNLASEPWHFEKPRMSNNCS